MSIESTKYVGRFAPSPTGSLHFGSLVAAVASYCDAKANNGKWLLRMEDVDKPREMAGAADDILCTLEAFGFEWDGAIIYQSRRAELYENTLQILKNHKLIYPCSCSRKEIADSSISTGIDGAIYPKTCFNKMLLSSSQNSASEKHASASRMNIGSWRINVDDAQNIRFLDAIQGEISQYLQTDIGDFILKRKDGLFAYQLAVVVDDFEQGVTHIARGADLLDSTPRQIYLQQLLEFTTPTYAHVPVAVNAQGEKLSKQTLAKAITPETAPTLLFEALQFLGQDPPQDIKNATLAEVWRWAIDSWTLGDVPKNRALFRSHI